MLASDGYTNFGGAQFTNALMRCCINEKIGREEFNALPVNTKRQVLKAIWQACEEAKIELSYSEDTRYIPLKSVKHSFKSLKMCWLLIFIPNKINQINHNQHSQTEFLIIKQNF